MARQSIKEYLTNNPRGVLVLDGGQGTELENRGIKVANPVWSTVPFINESFWLDPASKDREIVKSMYSDFLRSGAQVLMTITYQASFKSVSENTRIQTLSEYNDLLTKIVSFSRECIGDDKWLVGCIGAWGAHNCSEFTGDYGATPEKIDFLEYFKPQLMNFNENQDLDIIGFETVPNFHELKAILSWDTSIISKPFFIGLSVHEHGVLRDGTTMHEIAEFIKSLGPKMNPNFTLLGINCVSYNHSHDILESLHKEMPGFPLIAYPNSGEVYDTVKKIWNPKESQMLAWDDIVERYINSGARIIGGCCRTSPKDIQAIREAVDRCDGC
ncbi:LANO_0F14180g1_1 [Lachancea nothofagi CBS 11611]|uniref:homocysteine S-methyltransferase n=1 Tax=Lachancea nothofagi CBS 11611 TaxID=1266666 RepID=A0A1G4KC26_9SACH|nr:LANO_0F14180g1_1 [Lachancea nothofagi CBS 11611]